MTAPLTPFQLRRDRLRRWKDETDAELGQEQAANREASAEAVDRGKRQAEQSATFDRALEASREPAQDPFFQRTLAQPETPKPRPVRRMARPSEVSQVTPDREAEFQAWVKQNQITDLDHPDSHYDYRGAFLAGAMRDPATGHWPDPWKQHGHESFSDESQYARPGDLEAGHWEGDHFIPPARRPTEPAVPAVPTRRMGPGPSGGMRPSRRPVEAPPAETPDPYAADSRLARSLAGLRYQSVLTPLFGLGQTTAKIFHTVVQRPMAAAFEGPFRGAEQLLDERIKADEAREELVRQQHMSPAERVGQDIARFGVEFETAGRLAPILRAVPAARAVPEGASFLTRELASAGRLAKGAATEGAQFGAFEAGRSVATGEPADEAARRTGEGMLAGAIFGGGVPAVRSVAGGILRPIAEGAAALPGAVREGVRGFARDALVVDGMIRQLVRRATEVGKAAAARGDAVAVSSIDAIAKEAGDLSLLKTRTPDQRIRLQELNGRLRAEEARMAQEEPPPPLAESGAAVPDVPEALPHDIVERERRRQPQEVPGGAPEAPTGPPGPLPVAPESRPPEEAVQAPQEGATAVPEGGQAPTGAPEPPARPETPPPTPINREVTPNPEPPAPQPSGRGKKATPEALEAAFQKGRGENALQTLGGVQRAAVESGLRPSAEDVTALGKKVQRGGLRESALQLEIRERFGRSLDRPEFAEPEKAPQTFADALRTMDEQLATSEHRHYDVSRYGEGDITAARLPEPFYEASWKEGQVPTPGDLRKGTEFGGKVAQTLRRLEHASAQAARDADVVEHLGGKGLAGVKRARELATDLANQKMALEQQAERAIARAEEVHSEAARGKAGALNPDVSKAKIKPSDWPGNSMEPGEWVTDGHVMFRRADVDQLPAKRAEFYLKDNPSRKGITQELAAKLFKDEVAKATQKLEVLGHLPPEESTKTAHAFLVPEGKDTGLRRVNAALLRRLQEITKFDELRGRAGKDADTRAIAAYRNGEPVGLIMPIRMPDTPPFNVAEARELAGKLVEPPKRPGGTTTVAGLTVREPLTARTPMEPGFEQPLASASLPAAAQPQMTPPGTTGADVAAMRSRIVRKMGEILDIPVRVGKFRQRALGIYKIKPEVVRLKVAKDIEVLGHEVGHHIHNLFFGTSPRGGLSSNVLRPWWKELKPLAKGISDQTSSEGLAEFFRRYLTNPAEAKTAAPTFFDYVEQRLAKEFPEVKAMFEDARATYKTYLGATPEARVASNISLEPQRQWSFADKFRRFLTNVVDDMYDVERAQKEIISSALGLDAPPWWRPVARAKWMAEVSRQTRWEENAADLSRLVRGSAGQAEHFVKRGTLDFATLQVKGKSLEAVLRPVSQQFDEFLHYAVSRRAVELGERGVESGIRPEDAKAVIGQYASREHFGRAFTELQTYQQHLLEWLRDAGVLSHDTFDRILKQNEEYLPFYRVLDDEAARRAGAGTVFGRIFSPVKRIKGSGRDIINPFESIVKNTYLYTRLAARQRVAQALARLAERDGAGVWIERIPTPTNVTKIKLGEIWDQLAKKVLPSDVGPLDDTMAEEMLAVYRPGDYFGKDNIVSVIHGKKRVWYEVDPDLYKAMMALNHEQAGSMTRLLTFPAKTLRIGATLALEFIGRNPVRDQLAAFVQSEYGFKPGFDWGRGLFHMIRRDDLFWKWKAAGGERAALLELDRNSLAKSVREVLGRPPGAGEVLKDVIKSPIELLKLLSAAAEDATRIGEFARGVEREGTSRAGFEKAAASSREVSVDFARHGAQTEGIRLITAFWNARLQGYYRLGRAMRDHPVRTTYRAGVAITLPSVLLFYANKDDPEYWAKPQWERDLFWHVKVRGTYYKIPKPFELGIAFGTIPEHLLEWAHTHDAKGLQQALTQTLGSDLAGFLPIPTTLVPLIENFGNWSLFRRQPIVSRTLEDVQPAFQFTEGTSEVAKGLGRMLNLSPQKIDNLLFGWTGGLGRLATDLGDLGGQQVGLLPQEPRPSKTAADVPGVRGFVSKPAGRGSEDVERFYESWSKAQEAKSTRDLLHREDRLNELDTFEEKNADLLDRYDELKGYAKELAGLRHEIAETSRDETLTPDQRRKEIENLGREMQSIAAEAIERKTPAGRP